MNDSDLKGFGRADAGDPILTGTVNMSSVLLKPSLGMTHKLQTSPMFTSSCLLPRVPVGSLREPEFLKREKMGALKWSSSSNFASITQFLKRSSPLSRPGAALLHSFGGSDRRENLSSAKISQSFTQKRGKLMASLGVLPANQVANFT